jgi:hypothetical protein
VCTDVAQAVAGLLAQAAAAHSTQARSLLVACDISRAFNRATALPQTFPKVNR